MKYKVGDKVRIKSLDWYNENKDGYGIVYFKETALNKIMSKYCGQVATIEFVHGFFYLIDLDNKYWYWTDEMFEGCVEYDNDISNIDKLKRISTPATENWFGIAEEWDK